MNIPTMYHYYWKEKGKIVVQNMVGGFKGQEHKHTPKDFQKWIEENKIKTEHLINLDK